MVGLGGSSQLMFTRSNRVRSQSLCTSAHALIGLGWNVAMNVNTLLEQDKGEEKMKRSPNKQDVSRSHAPLLAFRLGYFEPKVSSMFFLLLSSVKYQGAHTCFFCKNLLLFSLHCSLGTFTQRMRNPRMQTRHSIRF